MTGRTETVEEAARVLEAPGEALEIEAPGEAPASEAGPSFLKRILTAETGPGEIEEYVGHPLNFDKSEGLGQVLRGFTGLLGNLRLAIVDLLVGAVRWLRRPTAPGPGG